LQKRPRPGLQEPFGRRWIDRAAVGEDQPPLEGVAKLPQVARPRVLQHPGPGARREGLAGMAEALAEVGEEVIENRRQVGAALAQRRHAEGEDLEAIEEVGAEELPGD